MEKGTRFVVFGLKLGFSRCLAIDLPNLRNINLI